MRYHYIPDRLVRFFVVVLVSSATLLVLKLSSCQTPQGNALGKELLGQAQEHYDAQRYAQAQQLLDSAISTSSTDTVLLRQCLSLKRAVSKAEAEQELQTINAQLPRLAERINTLLERFATKQDANYQSQARLFAPILLPERNEGKTYLRSSTDVNGNIEFVSVYTGPSKLNHSAIRIGSYTTPSVPADGALNYRYSVGGVVHELVTYSLAVSDSIAQALGSGKAQSVSYLSSGRVVQTYHIPTDMYQGHLQTIELSDSLRHRATMQERAVVLQRRLLRLSNQSITIQNTNN